MICWKRVEWHLPDRVMRQFGGVQVINVAGIPSTFHRVDGRGRADTDWFFHHAVSIAEWNDRRARLIPALPPHGDGNSEWRGYLRWYKSWATTYLLKPSADAPETYYPRSTNERLMAEYCSRTADIARRFSGDAAESASSMKLGYDEIAELSEELRRSVYFDSYEEPAAQESPASASRQESRRKSTSDAARGSRVSTARGPRLQPSQGTSSSHPWSNLPMPQFSFPWSIPEAGPSQMPPPPVPYMPYPMASPMMSFPGVPPNPYYGTPFYMPPTGTQDVPFMMPTFSSASADLAPEEDEQPAEPAEGEVRQRQGPDRYTPGSDAIPRRRKRR